MQCNTYNTVRTTNKKNRLGKKNLIRTVMTEQKTSQSSLRKVLQLANSSNLISLSLLSGWLAYRAIDRFLARGVYNSLLIFMTKLIINRLYLHWTPFLLNHDFSHLYATQHINVISHISCSLYLLQIWNRDLLKKRKLIRYTWIINIFCGNTLED